jgi:hypothetical protein
MPLQIEISIYKDLIVRYPIWEDLQKYLESDEGGLFKFTDKDNDGLCIIRYEKGVTNMELSHSKWFRSVVWNTNTNKPVCIAPPKASIQDFPYSTFKDIVDKGVVCQEFHEGFMINCFRVIGDETLHITSRSKLNAAGKFYSNKSFRELFIEAYMNTLELSDYDKTNIENNSHIISSPDSSKNEVAVFCSFLVQHNEHKIVKNIGQNRVYIIQKGRVYKDGFVIIDDTPDNNENMIISPIEINQQLIKGTYAQIAANDCEEYSEVQKWIKNFLLERGWEFQGLVFKDTFGNRWRFRSEKYSAVKALRGNSPSIIERFSQLYTQNLISKYLEYYSEETIDMTIYMMFMDIIVKNLYDNYIDLHITKEKKSCDIDKMFLPHLYSIHGIYLSQLKPCNKKVNFDEIKIYLHKQPWQRIAFLIKKIISKATE